VSEARPEVQHRSAMRAAPVPRVLQKNLGAHSLTRHVVLLARCSLEDHRPGETPHMTAEAAGEYFQAAMAGPNTQDTVEVFYLSVRR
jgi:hypothetical protein